MDEISDMEEIEIKLYIIKQNKFIYNEDFKKKYGFSFDINFFLSDNDGCIYIDKEEYHIYPTSRIIYFIDGQISKKKFIYSYKNFSDTLQSLNFDYFLAEEKEIADVDSIDSEISEEEKINIFKNNHIIYFKRDFWKIIFLF